MSKMDCLPGIICIFTTLLITSKWSTATLFSFLENFADVEWSQNTLREESFLFMNFLASYYTPKCLKIIFHSGTNYSSRPSPPIRPLSLHGNVSGAIFFATDMKKNKNININNTSGSPKKPQINLNAADIMKTKQILKYINENTERVTSYSCVTYIMTRPPDSRLLPLLTDSSSNKPLTRYFLVHTSNFTHAETLLLDQRLKEEENVAALTRHQTSKGSFWQISVRQLLHPSGSPQILRLNRWSRHAGLSNTNNIFPEQTNNFYGTRLKGVTLDFAPFIVYEDNDARLIRSRPCLDVFILNAIADTLNFTYDLFKSEDGHWGFLKPDVSACFVIFTCTIKQVAISRS